MDEGAALRLDSVKGFVTHEKSSIGFCPLEGENALEIISCGGEQIQVVGDVLIIIEAILCKEDGELSLNAKAGAKGLFQKVMFPKRGLGVVVEQEHVEGQAVCRGKFGCGKGFQLFFVLSGLGNGSGVVGGEGAKGGEGTGDALFFGIGQGIMEIQGISRDLFFEDGLSKIFEAGVLGYDMAREPWKDDAGGKYKGKGRNHEGFLPGMRQFFEGGEHGESSLPEGFLLYY